MREREMLKSCHNMHTVLKSICYAILEKFVTAGGFGLFFKALYFHCVPASGCITSFQFHSLK